MVLQLLASLSFLIILHELGHFLAARYFGVRVIKFYLFFDFLFPMANVMNFSLFKKKVGDTEYGIGWFPFGGYVQMAGIMDESMDKEAMKLPPKPDEFRAKAPWQRLIILLGGIIMNILIAFVLYAVLAFVWGDKFLPAENAEYGVYAYEIGRDIGIENGDKIVKVGETTLGDINDITSLLIFDESGSITVERDGKLIDLTITDAQRKEIVDRKGADFITLAFPAIIGEFAKGSAIEKAGALAGDEVIRFDGIEITSLQQMNDVKLAYTDTIVSVDLLRDGSIITVKPELGANSMLGFGPLPASEMFELETKEYSFFQALVEGPVRTWEVFSGYAKSIKFLFKPKNEGWKHIGSFGTFAKLFPVPFNLQMFLERTALISVILAFMNLLPIPALDGGHAMFTIYEMVFRRKPNERFMEIAQLVGMVMLLGLMALGIFNDAT